MKRLEIAAAQHDNAEMKDRVKALTETLRNDPNLTAVPLATSYIIEKFGPEAQAYVNAEVLNTLFQSAPEIAALDSGTDVQINLSAVPQVVVHPLWDKVAAEVNAEPRHVTEERTANIERLFDSPLKGDPFADVELPQEVTEETKRQVAAQLMAAGMSSEKARVQADILTRFLAKPLLAMGVKDFGQWFRDRLKIVDGRKTDGEGGRTLHQPMNAGLDLDRLVKTVIAENRLPAGEWRTS